MYLFGILINCSIDSPSLETQLTALCLGGSGFEVDGCGPIAYIIQCRR